MKGSSDRFLYLIFFAFFLLIALWPLLRVMSYLAITPVGLLMRLLGNDITCLKFGPDAPSYWIRIFQQQ